MPSVRMRSSKTRRYSCGLRFSCPGRPWETEISSKNLDATHMSLNLADAIGFWRLIIKLDAEIDHVILDCSDIMYLMTNTRLLSARTKNDNYMKSSFLSYKKAEKVYIKPPMDS